MNDSLAIAVFAGLGGMVGWGAADFLAKKTIDQIGDLTTLFWAQVIGVVPLLAIFAVNREIPTMHTWDPVWLILLGIVSALSYLSLYAGFGKGQVSFLSPVFASHAAVVVAVSALIFHEHITAQQWMAIGVVIFGVVAISTDPRDLGRILRTRRRDETAGLTQVLSAGVAYALWLVMLDRFLGGRDWVFFLLVIRIGAAATLYCYARITKRPLALTPAQRPLRGYLMAIGVFDVAAFGAVSWGFSATTHTSVVAVLASAFSVPTLFLARMFLNERLMRAQQVAAGIILTGIALVSIA
jgi:drug/metabolite transporter (DMT)-like permease